MHSPGAGGSLSARKQQVWQLLRQSMNMYFLMDPTSPLCMSERCLAICQAYGEADPHRWPTKPYLQLICSPSWILLWHRIRNLDLKYWGTVNKTPPQPWNLSEWNYKTLKTGDALPLYIHICSKIFNGSPLFYVPLVF